MRSNRLLFSAALLLGLAIPAEAGNLRVAPLKVFFDEDTKSATLQVRNSGKEGTTIQASVRRWTIGEDGRDAFEATQDFVFFPHIFEIQPGEEGIVRLAYRGDADHRTERAYRIFLRELPTPGDQEEGVGFLIELSVPIFIRAQHPRAEGSISTVGLSEGRAEVWVENRGTEFFLVDTVVASGRDAAGKETFRAQIGGWYVLAGSTRVFSVGMKPEDCRRSHTLVMQASWSGTDHPMQFQVHPEECPAESAPTRPAPSTGQ